MIFSKKEHNTNLYNILLFLSRNIFFYKSLSLKDTFETRVYLMFIHYSIILIIFKRKKFKVDQNNYNNLFHCIENNLREMGFGDVSVNKKMKDLNKLFYDILLKINTSSNDDFKINKNLVTKYFEYLCKNDEKWKKLEIYFNKFYKFCFDISPKYMLEGLKTYKY